jgi:threonine dehydrogenase-like Zn-dependent dehydrogenase
MDAGTMRDGTTRLHRGGERVHHLALVSSFADHAVVPANGAIPVTERLEPALACLLGCGVTTGVMSVTRRANVRPGESVAVFGCGGVGLAAILGSRPVSAEPLIAVDPAAGQAGDGTRDGCDACRRSGRRRSRRADPGDRPGGVDCALRRSASLPSPTRRSARSGRRDDRAFIGQPAMGVKAGFDVYDVTQFEHHPRLRTSASESGCCAGPLARSHRTRAARLGCRSARSNARPLGVTASVFQRTGGAAVIVRPNDHHRCEPGRSRRRDPGRRRFPARAQYLGAAV